MSESGIKVSFSGKETARKIARIVMPRVSQGVKQFSVGSEDDQSKNLLIEGDNLQALASLRQYQGHVDFIVTDPPYNTGKGDFRYNDKWSTDPNDDSECIAVSERDPALSTKWMSFMLPRLQLMREMLKPSGVLAIHIDHRELFRLGMLMNEVFGEDNVLAPIVWQKAYGGKGTKHVSSVTEYILVAFKNKELGKTGVIPLTQNMNDRHNNPDNDLRGEWRNQDSSAPGERDHYAIQNPITGDMVYPPNGASWRRSRIKMKSYLEDWGSNYKDKDIGDALPALVIDGDIEQAKKRATKIQENGPWPELFFNKKGKGKARLKYYSADRDGTKPTSLWLGKDSDESVGVGYSQTGTEEVKALLGHGQFETVKPLALTKRIISLWSPENGLVLDPFGGSGTTGHAVLDLNKATGSDRRFILIEQGNGADKYARTLTSARLKAAIKTTGGGFRFVTLKGKVDANALNEMNREEMIDAIIGSHKNLIKMESSYQYLVARNSNNEGFFLVWDGDTRTKDLFTNNVYNTISKEAKQAGLKTPFHVYAQFFMRISDDVIQHQIPEKILIDFGISATESYYNEV